MKLIKQSHKIWEQETPPRLLNHDVFVTGYLKCMFEHIERCGRVCYKSEDKIGPETAEKFVNGLIEAKHYAMLEHGTVYLTVKTTYNDEDAVAKARIIAHKYECNKYSHVCLEAARSEPSGRGIENYYITTNYRVIIENGWEKDLAYVDVPTKHLRKVTAKLTTSRQIAMELLRHRPMSFAMESTRYCNYSKNKFGSELTFIKPVWLSSESILIEDPVYSEANAHFQWALEATEHTYFDLIKANWKPQQAATILPNALKADLVVTGFVKDWEHIFDLRVKGTTGAPHPQMLELMKPVYNEFVKRNYIQE